MFLKMGRKGNAYTLLMGLKIGVVTMKNSLTLLQKIKNWTTI